MQTVIAENSRTALDQNGYNRRYVDLTEMYNTIKADYDKISEQIAVSYTHLEHLRCSEHDRGGGVKVL